MSLPLALVWDLIAVDKASPVFNRVSRNANVAATAMDRAVLRFNAGARKMQTTGAAMTRRFTVPLAAIGVVSGKMATDFNAAMTRISTQAGGTAKDVSVLSKQVLGLAKYAEQGPVDLANALYHLKSVGLGNVAAMKALRQASDFAAVGNANLEETTNALAGAWRTGIKGAGNFHTAVKTLNAIIGAGNMSMEDLNAALGTGILPTAKTFGLTLKDVGSALALFTDEGVPANNAATRLRMSFSLLGAPSARAEKQLKSIGLTGLKLANDMRKPNGLIRAIGDLKSHLEDPKYKLSLSQQAQLLSHAFGGGRSSSAILSLINNFDVLKKKQDQVTESLGKYDKAVAQQRNTPQAKFKLLESSLQRSAIMLGDQLLPIVINIANKIASVAEKFNSLSEGNKKIVVYAGLALLALGPVLSILAKIGLAFKAMILTGLGMRRLIAGITAAEISLKGMESTAYGAGLKIRGAFVGASTGAVALRSALAGIAIGGGLGYLTRNASTTTKVLTDLGAAASSAAIGFAVGGPLGAAIGGITGLVSSLGAQFLGAGHSASAGARAAQAALARQKQSAHELLTVLQSVNGQYKQQYKNEIISKLQANGGLENAAAAGLAPKTVTNAALGDTRAVAAIEARMRVLQRGTTDANGVTTYNTNATEALQGVLNALAEVSPAARKAERAYELFRAAQGRGIVSSRMLAGGLKNLGKEFSNTGNALTTDSDKTRANSAYAARNTAIVKANLKQIVANSVAQLRHGKNIDKVAAAYHRHVAALDADLVKLGFNKASVDALTRSNSGLAGKLQTVIDKLHNMPKQVTTHVDVKTGDVITRMDNIISRMHTIGRGVNGVINITTTNTSTGARNTVKARAAGGGLPQGFASVGERGAELAYTAGGKTHIFSHAQSKAILAMTGMRAPGFAGGTPPAALPSPRFTPPAIRSSATDRRPVNVRVFIGDREIRDIVRVEMGDEFAYQDSLADMR